MSLDTHSENSKPAPPYTKLPTFSSVTMVSRKRALNCHIINQRRQFYCNNLQTFNTNAIYALPTHATNNLIKMMEINEISNTLLHYNSLHTVSAQTHKLQFTIYS